MDICNANAKIIDFATYKKKKDEELSKYILDKILVSAYEESIDSLTIKGVNIKKLIEHKHRFIDFKNLCNKYCEDNWAIKHKNEYRLTKLGYDLILAI
jgi:hypothetical protein